MYILLAFTYFNCKKRDFIRLTLYYPIVDSWASPAPVGQILSKIILSYPSLAFYNSRGSPFLKRYKLKFFKAILLRQTKLRIRYCVSKKFYMRPNTKSAKRQVRSAESSRILNTTLRLSHNAVPQQNKTKMGGTLPP